MNIKFVLPSMFLLIWISLYSTIASAEMEVVFFTYEVEVKRQESQTWEFIQSEGIRLQETDRVRVPPDAIFIVETEDGRVKVPPGQEDFVINLTEKAKLQKGNPPPQELDWDTDVDANEPVQRASGEKSLPALDLEELRALAVIDDSLLKVVLGEFKPSTQDYPYQNLGYAIFLFDEIMKLIKPKEKASEKKPQSARYTWHHKQGDEVEIAILYYALLRQLDISVDFKPGTDSSLLVLFDSGFTEADINYITVNRMLYQTENQKTRLPIRFIRQNSNYFNDNFITRWYEGGRAVTQLSQKKQ